MERREPNPQINNKIKVSKVNPKELCTHTLKGMLGNC